MGVARSTKTATFAKIHSSSFLATIPLIQRTIPFGATHRLFGVTGWSCRVVQPGGVPVEGRHRIEGFSDLLRLSVKPGTTTSPSCRPPTSSSGVGSFPSNSGNRTDGENR